MALEVLEISNAFSRNYQCSVTLLEIMCRMNFPHCINDTSYNVCGSGCNYLYKNCIKDIDVCSLNSDINPSTTICSFSYFIIFQFLNCFLLML